MTMIDLGEVRDEFAPPMSARRPRATGRPLRVGMVVVLLLAVLAAAAPPPVPVWAVVPGTSGAQAFMTEDTLYVVEPPAGGGEIAAYPLPERATAKPQRPQPRWRVRVPSTGSGFWIVRAPDGSAVVSVEAEGGTGIDTVALDGATGRTRWRQPGVAAVDAAGQVLIQGVGDTGVPDLRSVDLVSGAVRWSRPSTLQGATFRTRDGAIVAIVQGTPTGATEVLDPRTGAVLAGAEVPIPGDGGRQVVGDLLMVAGSGVVTAYGLDDLTRRWETPMFSVSSIAPCGALACAVGVEGGIRALDPATGDVRWETPEVTDILTHGENRALAVDQSPEDLPRVLVLDLTDGRQIADLGRWLPSRWNPDRAAAMVGVRPLPGGGLLATVLDAAATDAPRVHALPDAASECQGRTVLVCRLGTGGFGMWRLSGRGDGTR